MDHFKYISAGLLGVVFGMSCKSGIELVDTASAAQDSQVQCTQWKFDSVDAGDEIPPGWEPFAWPGGPVGVRKCESWGG